MAVSHIKSNTIADFTGTVTVFNSAGATASANATDLVRPSDWNSGHNQYLTLSGNTANLSVLSGTNIVLQGGNNVTLSGASAAGAATVVVSGIDFVWNLVGNTAGTSSSNLSANSFYLSGGTNITLSGNSNTIVISANNPITENYFNGWSIVGNTVGTNVTALTTETNLYLSGGTNITLSGNSNTIVISGNNPYLFNTATTGANLAFTYNSSGISINGASVAGTTTAVTGGATVTLNSAGFRFNGSAIAGTGTSIGSTTGTMSIALNTTGLTLAQPMMTRYIWPIGELTAVTAPANASMSFQYVAVPGPVTATRLDALVGMSLGSAATNATGAFVYSAYAVIYTKNANSLSSLSSGSTQTTFTYASNSAGQTQLTQSAVRPISVPINVNMAPGEYVIGFNWVTNGTSSIGATTTNYGATISMYGGNGLQTAVNYAEMSAQTATSQGLYVCGVYNAASTGMPASVSVASINQTGSALSAGNIALVLRNA